MNKFIVVSDIDSCINNLLERTFEIYNERHGTNYTIAQQASYNLEDNFPMYVADEIKEIFLEKELWDSLTPVDGAQWALKSFINSGYDVYLATGTHHVNFPWKIEWLKKHFGFIDSKNIIRIHNKSLLKCDVLIEDCYENLIDAKAPIGRILMNKPWNKNSANKDYIYGINRVDNWDDIVKYVNQIYKDEMEW